MLTSWPRGTSVRCRPTTCGPCKPIKRRALELYDLIKSLLDLSRLQRAEQLPVDLQAVHLPALLTALQEEMQELYAPSGLEVVWAIDPHLAPLWTDPGKLKTVLKNLLGNAIKFTRAGQIIVTASARSAGVEVSISDTGPGIPQETLALIFEPFRQLDSSITRSPLEGWGWGCPSCSPS